MENIIIGIRKTAHIPRASQKPFYKTIKKETNSYTKHCPKVIIKTIIIEPKIHTSSWSLNLAYILHVLYIQCISHMYSYMYTHLYTHTQTHVHFKQLQNEQHDHTPHTLTHSLTQSPTDVQTRSS